MKSSYLRLTISVLVLVLFTIVCFSAGCNITAEEIKSERVTASEWNAAFAEKSFVGQNFKFEYLKEVENPKGVKTWHKEYTGVSDGSLEYVKEFVKKYYNVEVTEGDNHYYECEADYTPVDKEFYLERTDVTIWRYENQNGEWLKNGTQINSIIWNWIKNNCLCQVKYGDVSYDETLKGYVYNKPEFDDGSRTTYYVFKFDKEKRLKAVTEESFLIGDGKCEQYSKGTTLFTYGKQRVNLPKTKK